MTLSIRQIVELVHSGDLRRVDSGALKLDVSPSKKSAGTTEAVLEVREGGRLLGYITRYSPNQYGVVRASEFGLVLPELRRNWDRAVDDLID